MPLRLIHLSDIHFGGYGAGWDEDEDQRRELIRDVERLVGKSPVVDGILVGGDVAFSGDPDEYKSSRAWLAKLCETCGITFGRVWVVPGNHDISLPVIGNSPASRDFRRAVRECSAEHIDSELNHRLAKDPAAEGVMKPLGNYNDFAEDFNCGITARQPIWFDASTLVCDGFPVRLTGLNSALVSDSNDGTDPESRKLVLGTWQCTLPRGDGLIHVALCHHPPNWLRDWNLVDPYLRRAHLVLFGHEHKFAARQLSAGGTVHVFAGAVGPERLGGQPDEEYLPSWDLITIKGEGEVLNVEVEPRVWHRADTCFGEHPDGAAGFTVQVSLPPTGAEEPEPRRKDVQAPEPMAASPLAATTKPPAGMAGESGAERRQLAIRFMMLAPSRRLELARGLGVIEEPADLDLPRAKLYETILVRIRERGLIDRLSEEIERG